MMKTNIFMYSSAGGRKNNEDRCHYALAEDGAVFALADGLGGHDCGEIASEIAVSTAISALTGKSPATLGDVIAEINDTIKKRQVEDVNLMGMRTTLVCAKLAGNDLFYAAVGDSRFYYFKAMKKLLRTKDHSVPQMSVDMGTLREEDVRYSDDRNKLLKVLGESGELTLPAEYPPIAVESGDAFLLCSDGFWENVFDAEMEIDLHKAANAKEWAHFMLKRLLLRVSGSHDNFSLICGMIL